MFTTIVSVILILCADVLTKTPISHSLIKSFTKVVVDVVSI